MMLPRVSESSTPKRWSAVFAPCVESTFRFFERISARVMRQSFSALVLAMACSERAFSAAVCELLYCHTDVAMRPATPITKLERKLEYVWMKRPNFVDSKVLFASGLTGGGYSIGRLHAVARAALRQVGPPPPTPGGRRAHHLGVLPAHLARAGRGGLPVPTRAARAR